MDALLSTITHQAWNYAIRSGINITTNYVYQQSSKLIKKTDKLKRNELILLQERLTTQMGVISPAIDMIEMISARGNSSLSSAKGLTSSLRRQIQALGKRMADAVEQEEKASGLSSLRGQEAADTEIAFIIEDVKDLLKQVESAVPLFNLAITASGASLTGELPKTVSPTRLCQASQFLCAGDAAYTRDGNSRSQIGHTFTLSLYMLFSSHVREGSEEDIRNTTWQEVLHKARVKLFRVRREDLDHLPGDKNSTAQNQGKFLPAESRRDEYAYQMIIIEDLDDGRVHDNEVVESYQGVTAAGIREVIPIHQIAKIFWADTGKVLNIGNAGEAQRPVLLLRRDLNAQPPRRLVPANEEILDEMDSFDSGENHRLPADQAQSSQNISIPIDPHKFSPSLNPEWLAFEVFEESVDSDDDEADAGSSDQSRRQSVDDSLTDALSQLDLCGSQDLRSRVQYWQGPQVSTTLSLLEVLLRLLSFQQYQQMSHLTANDETLNFFLSEAVSTGAQGDVERQRARAMARRTLGWDPHDESPIKKRGEQYQYGHSIDESDVAIPTNEFDSELTTPNPNIRFLPRTPTSGLLLSEAPHLSPRSSPTSELPPLPDSAGSSGTAQSTPSGAARFRKIQKQARYSSPLADRKVKALLPQGESNGDVKRENAKEDDIEQDSD